MKKINTAIFENQNTRPNIITRILWWFSTVVPETISDCTTDRHRAKIIGLSVLFTWIYASLAWIYFWSMNNSNPFIYIPLGLFIGFGILTIDRMLIASISKHKKNFMAITFRIILSLLLGASIAQPLILWMFEKDINAEVSVLQDKNVLEKRNELESTYLLDKSNLTLRKENILKEKATKYATLEQVEKDFLQEIDGTGGSKKYGIAGIAAQKEKAMLRAKQTYQDFETQSQPEINLINSQLEAINQKIQKDIDFYKTHETASGFLIRIEALQSLLEKDTSNALLKRYSLILIILVLFELIPIISKLYLPTGSYDDKIKIRDEIELEMAYANKEKELELKLLYNSLAQEDSSKLIQQLFADFEVAKKHRLEEIAADSKSAKSQTFDELWNRIKWELLLKQEN